MKQKILRGSLVFLSLCLLVTSGLFLGGANAADKTVSAETKPCNPCPQNPKEETKKITVSGEGRVTVDPDICYIHLSVSEQLPTAKEASDAVNTKMEEIFKLMEEMGIEKKDLKTLNFNLYPQYDYQSSPPQRYAFEAVNRIEIKVRDMEKVGEILAAALDAGANNVDSVSYDLIDKTKAYQKALGLAVQAAQKKAGVMADACDVKIDPVPSLLGESRSVDYGFYDYDNRPAEMEMASDEALPVALAANQIVITANVEAAYDIVP